MKKLVFATLMCVAAMSARAQVLTSETVNHIYSETVFNTTNGDYCFNADKNGNDITTLYVYQKVSGPKGNVTLIPHLKHEYDYAATNTPLPMRFIIQSTAATIIGPNPSTSQQT